MEMIPVKVSDILHQWSRSKNLDVLKKLDQRFLKMNILGMWKTPIHLYIYIEIYLYTTIEILIYLRFRKNRQYSETSSSKMYLTTSSNAGVFIDTAILSQRISNTHQGRRCSAEYRQGTIRQLIIHNRAESVAHSLAEIYQQMLRSILYLYVDSTPCISHLTAVQLINRNNTLFTII